MPASSTRMMLRPTRLALRRAPLRHASTTSEAASSTAQKAKEGVSNTTTKASEGLSKVTSSASSTASSAASAASSAASTVATQTTGRVGRLAGLVQSTIPPTVYYSKVGWETAKLIFQGQKMQPPNVAQIQTYYQRLLQTLRNPSSLVSQNPGLLNPQQALERIQNINRAQLTTAGILVAELLGFFTVGEIIGKLKIVGYRGKVEHH